MLNRVQLSALLVIAALLWGGLLVLDGVKVQVAWLRPFSAVVGVVLLILLAFDLWAWRLRILRGWFVPRPNLRGTWRVELTSDWKEPESDNPVGAITAFLVIRQTFSTLSVRMLTKESSSEVVAAEINKGADGTYRVAAVYRNEPMISIRERSPIHYGGMLVNVHGDPVEELAGHYWTDRQSRGALRTVARHDSIVSSYGKALTLGAGAAESDVHTSQKGH